MEQIGKYLVRKVLISTGFSTIYLSFDPDLETEVAVKVFHVKGENAGPKAKYGEAEWRERFIREARLLANLDHPNIVPVKEMATTDDGRPYFVMPFIKANLIYEIGRDVMDADAIARLPERERPKRVAPARAVSILRQVLGALAALHRLGLVHRDVKPGNVLLTRGQGGSVRLCDFGMVKFPDWKSSRAGIWIGTLDYISPEQRENATAVDARADVYSTGALAYRMLTGKLPVGAFPPIGEHGVAVPAGVPSLIMKALSPDKAGRPKDASEMLRRLDQAWSGPASRARQTVARIVPASRRTS